MEVIVILLACSLGLVVLALGLFVYSVRQGDCDRAETLCLLPLEDDAEVPIPGGTEARAAVADGPGEDCADRSAKR